LYRSSIPGKQKEQSLPTSKKTLSYWGELVGIPEKMAFVRAVRHLPAQTYKVLMLHYGQQKSIKDIAVITGKSVSTVRNHHNRGIFLLRKYAAKDMNK